MFIVTSTEASHALNNFDSYHRNTATTVTCDIYNNVHANKGSHITTRKEPLCLAFYRRLVLLLYIHCSCGSIMFKTCLVDYVSSLLLVWTLNYISLKLIFKR